MKAAVKSPESAVYRRGLGIFLTETQPTDTPKHLSRLSSALALAILTVTTPLFAAPSNDNFVNAEVISGSYAQENGSTVESTLEAGEPTQGYNEWGSIWYRWTSPGYNGTLTAALKVFNNGFQNAHQLELYQAAGSGTILELALLARQGVLGGRVESTSIAVSPSTTYYVRIVAFTFQSTSNPSAPYPSPIQLTLDLSPKDTWSASFKQASDSYNYFAGLGDYHLAVTYYKYYYSQGLYNYYNVFGNTATALYAYCEGQAYFHYYYYLRYGDIHSANYSYYYYYAFAYYYYYYYYYLGYSSYASVLYYYYISLANAT